MMVGFHKISTEAMIRGSKNDVIAKNVLRKVEFI